LGRRNILIPTYGPIIDASKKELQIFAILVAGSLVAKKTAKLHIFIGQKGYYLLSHYFLTKKKYESRQRFQE
jgi:hypothetical protein